MPTILTHAVVACGVGRVLTRSRPMPPLFWLLAAGLSILPDADVVAWPLGIPWGTPWAHRGISHGFPTAALVSYVVARLAHRPLGLPLLWLWGYYFLAMASHGFLDAFTNGGPGVAFLAPFDHTRYFFPWRPLVVSPIGLDIVSEWGLRTITSEIVWVWLPTAALVGAAALARRRAAARAGREA
jgi:inner membrane protein